MQQSKKRSNKYLFHHVYICTSPAVGGHKFQSFPLETGICSGTGDIEQTWEGGEKKRPFCPTHQPNFPQFAKLKLSAEILNSLN